MPYILLAGQVANTPKSQPFPTTGRPRCETTIRVEGISAEIYPIVGFDSAIVAEISQQTQKDKSGKYVVVGVRVEARQILALAHRSVNKAQPVQMAARPIA